MIEEIHSARKKFEAWLEANNAEDIEIYQTSPESEWDYYAVVTALVNDKYYSVSFRKSKLENPVIDYEDEDNIYNKIEIYEFLMLIE